uniref:ATP synthase complex subunit 8 n=1 Tax=Acidiella didymera TaxID=2894345 RepID=A0A8K2AS80_9MUSC|nr:ATP synthase F0 subunit 8 [Acidiella didymera]
MPQMAPMGWLNLFIIFSITFILFSMMNYYMTLYKSPQSKTIYKLSMKSLNWKW